MLNIHHTAEPGKRLNAKIIKHGKKILNHRHEHKWNTIWLYFYIRSAGGAHCTWTKNGTLRKPEKTHKYQIVGIFSMFFFFKFLFFLQSIGFVWKPIRKRNLLKSNYSFSSSIAQRAYIATSVYAKINTNYRIFIHSNLVFIPINNIFHFYEIVSNWSHFTTPVERQTNLYTST